MNQGYFLLKGLRQVRAEFSLSALAYNLLRAINLVGVKELVRACGRLLHALRLSQNLTGWFYHLAVALAVLDEQNPVAVHPSA